MCHGTLVLTVKLVTHWPYSDYVTTKEQISNEMLLILHVRLTF